MVTIWTSTQSVLVFSLLPGCQESQLSLVVSVWLSGVVVDRTFTLGGVGVTHHYSLIIAA